MTETPFAEIVSRYIPSTEKPETYEIHLPAGEPIVCRRMTRYADVTRFEKELAEFWKRCEDLTLAPAARPYAPQDIDEARAAFTLMFHSCEPTKFDEASACAYLTNPIVLRTLLQQIESRHYTDLAETINARVEAGKASSPSTLGTASEPSSATGAKDASPES